MSHVPGGLVYKRFLNALRPADLGVPDPFFSDVILLLKFNDTGDTFTDLSLLSNPVSLLGSSIGIFEQNSSNLLFNENTLQITQPGGFNKFLKVQNAFDSCSPSDNICIEYWFNQNTKSLFTESPVHNRFVPSDPLGNPVGSSLFESSTTALPFGSFAPLKYRNAFTNWVSFDTGEPLLLNSWNYVAMQYKGATQTLYCYANGSLVASLAGALGLSQGWVWFLGGISAGFSASNLYSLWFSNLRITRALRYDAMPTISIPTGPFPTF